MAEAAQAEQGGEGQPSSLLPPALRWAGPLLAFLYGLGVTVHRAASSPKRAPIPVICVGNLTVGGTGKTPAVKYFARELLKLDRKPAVLMRGYKEQGGDEAREIEKALGDKVPVILGADRLAGCILAREKGCDIALLDDGFQHWKLARDLDIVLVDASNPFGGGHLIPWGRLRESPAGLSRAGMVIITRADRVASDKLDRIEETIRILAPCAIVATACHQPTSTYDCVTGRPVELNGLPIMGFCGIGNPESFRDVLWKHSRDVRGFVSFPDHFNYSANILIRDVVERAKSLGATTLATTEKDAAKLKEIAKQIDLPVCVVAVEFKLLRNSLAVSNRIAEALGRSAKLNPSI